MVLTVNKDYKVKSELLVQSDRKVFKASKDYKVKLVP